MEIKSVNAMFRPDFDKIAVHPLQSWSWGNSGKNWDKKLSAWENLTAKN